MDMGTNVWATHRCEATSIMQCGLCLHSSFLGCATFPFSKHDMDYVFYELLVSQYHTMHKNSARSSPVVQIVCRHLQVFAGWCALHEICPEAGVPPLIINSHIFWHVACLDTWVGRLKLLVPLEQTSLRTQTCDRSIFYMLARYFLCGKSANLYQLIHLDT
jgi:hypothetical protein